MIKQDNLQIQLLDLSKHVAYLEFEVVRLRKLLATGPTAACCTVNRGHDYDHGGVCVRGCGIPEGGFVHKMQQEVERLSGVVEQQEVQLAECSIATQGWNKDPAVQGQYGWSPAYQNVLELRLKFDCLSALAQEDDAV
jgi:hypothetical protein